MKSLSFIKHKLILIAVCCLYCALMISSCEDSNKQSKERAKAIFLQATSRLYETGGIATFEVPKGQKLNRPIPNMNLSKEEYRRMLQESIREFNEAIDIDPSLNEVYYHLGIAYLQLQDVQNAINAFSNTVKLEPQREIAYTLLSSLLIEKKKYEKARTIAAYYLNQFPNKEANVFDIVALSYYKEGNYEAAIEKGKEMLSVNSKHIGAHLVIANSYYKLGKKEASEKEYNIVIKLDPKMIKTIRSIKSGLNGEEN